MVIKISKQEDLKTFAKKLGITLSDEQIDVYEKQFEKSGDSVDVIAILIKYLRRIVFLVVFFIGILLVMISLILYVAYFYLPSGYYDIYIDSTIIAVMAFISPIVTELFMAKFGRKTVCNLFLSGNFLCALLALIIQSAGGKGRAWMDLIGFFMASSFTQAFGVYGIDLLPLTIRSEAQAIFILFTRVGAGVAPLMIIEKDSPDLWWIHYLVFLILIPLAMICISLLPETARRSSLTDADDLEDAIIDPSRMNNIASGFFRKCGIGQGNDRNKKCC